MIPVTVKKFNSKSVISHGKASDDIDTREPELDNTQDERYKEWLYYDIHQSQSINNLINSIVQGTAIGACDGSFKEEVSNGTAGWTIENLSGESFITGITLIPGNQEDQSAYRSELGGILAIVNKLKELCTTYNIAEGALTLYCDNISALY